MGIQLDLCQRVASFLLDAVNVTLIITHNAFHKIILYSTVSYSSAWVLLYIFPFGKTIDAGRRELRFFYQTLNGPVNAL